MTAKTSSRWVLLPLVTAIVLFLSSILPLIGSIQNIEFVSGRDTITSGSASVGGPPPQSRGWRAVMILVRVFATVAALTFLFELIVDRAFRKFLLFIAVLLAAIAFASEHLGLNRMTSDEVVAPDPGDLWTRSVAGENADPTRDRQVTFTQIQGVVLAFLLSALVVGIGAAMICRWHKRQGSLLVEAHEYAVLEIPAHGAQQARAADDARSVVLFCYQEMINILSAATGIDPATLTPREFEVSLRSLGLADGFVACLTRVFEIVRYSDRFSNDFVAQAWSCLDAVRDAHRENEVGIR